MTDRAGLIVERLETRLEAVCKAVPPIKAPKQYWLDSDSSASYCFDCAIIARGMEFELGPLIHVPDWWARTDWDDVYFSGIDGGMDGEGDHTEACEICRRTLSYILTDYGVEQEIDFYAESPLVDVRDEDSYALDRLALNVWSGAKREVILGVVVAVNQAWRILKARGLV